MFFLARASGSIGSPGPPPNSPNDSVERTWPASPAQTLDKGWGPSVKDDLWPVLHSLADGHRLDEGAGREPAGSRPSAVVRLRVDLQVLAMACACDFLSYMRILKRHEGFVHLRPEVVGTHAPHSILSEAQVGEHTTLQAVERLAQHLLGQLDPPSEGGRSAFVGVAEGQSEFAVLAADDGQG